jgi:hypothetical protein
MGQIIFPNTGRLIAKTAGRYFRNIVIIVLISIPAESAIWSQAPADSIRKGPGFFIGLTGGASMNRIINKGILYSNDPLKENKIFYSGSFGIETGYFFNRSIGISTGIGYSSYKAELFLDTYSNKFTATDSENETFEMRVSGSGIKEIQDISFISIPLCLDFQIPAGQSFGIFLQAGVNFAFPVNHGYNSSGTFTYTGYYPAYNIVFHDLPEYGFPTDIGISTADKLNLKSMVIQGLAAAGLQYTFKNKYQIKLGACYSRSPSTISQYTSPGSFQLSSGPDRMNSLMGGAKSTTTESIGLRLSFRYFIR